MEVTFSVKKLKQASLFNCIHNKKTKRGPSFPFEKKGVWNDAYTNLLISSPLIPHDFPVSIPGFL